MYRGLIRHSNDINENLFTYPFHAVTGGNLTEHRVVAQDFDVSRIGQLWVVGGRAEVELAL